MFFRSKMMIFLKISKYDYSNFPFSKEKYHSFLAECFFGTGYYYRLSEIDCKKRVARFEPEVADFDPFGSCVRMRPREPLG